MAPVKLEVAFLLPLIARSGIEDLFARDPRGPGGSRQRPGGARLHANRAAAAKTSLQRWPAEQIHIRENGSQSHPRPESAGDQLTVPTDPSQARTRRGSLVRKVAFDVHRIRTIGSRKRFRAMAVLSDAVGQCDGRVVDEAVHPRVLVRICAIRAVSNARHDVGIHRNRKRYRDGKPLSRPVGRR